AMLSDTKHDHILSVKTLRRSRPGTWFFNHPDQEPDACLFIPVYVRLDYPVLVGNFNALHIQESRRPSDGLLGAPDGKTAKGLDFGMVMFMDHPSDRSGCDE
ncbi:MAG TPA: hypothetical protein VK900_03480, partial [Anaerolineales bacterium]|nr:hypothetical protein [Anaerolineales bacterium]